MPGATFLWSIAKPVTEAVSLLPVSAPRFISAPHFRRRRSGGIRSPVGISRLMSGMMPSSGPVRVITRATMGAAVQAAVVWPEVAAVGRAESIMTITT